MYKFYKVEDIEEGRFFYYQQTRHRLDIHVSQSCFEEEFSGIPYDEFEVLEDLLPEIHMDFIDALQEFPIFEQKGVHYRRVPEGVHLSTILCQRAYINAYKQEILGLLEKLTEDDMSGMLVKSTNLVVSSFDIIPSSLEVQKHLLLDNDELNKNIVKALICDKVLTSQLLGFYFMIKFKVKYKSNNDAHLALPRIKVKTKRGYFGLHRNNPIDLVSAWSLTYHV